MTQCNYAAESDREKAERDGEQRKKAAEIQK
jgi:hypothetical protein